MLLVLPELGLLVLRDGGAGGPARRWFRGERVMRRGCPSRSTACLACLYWLVLAPPTRCPARFAAADCASGTRAGPAACRRRLRDVVLNLSVSVYLAINLTKDLARARARYVPPSAPATDARICRALPQRPDSSERRNRLAAPQQHCLRPVRQEAEFTSERPTARASTQSDTQS